MTQAESWTVLGDDGEVVAPIERFLASLKRSDRAKFAQDYQTSLASLSEEPFS